MSIKNRLVVARCVLIIIYVLLLGTGCAIIDQDRASIAKENDLPLPFILQLWENGCVPANLVAHTMYYFGSCQWDQYQIFADGNLNGDDRMSLAESHYWLNMYPGLPYDSISYPWSAFLQSVIGTIDNDGPIMTGMSRDHMGSIIAYTWNDTTITGFGWLDPASRSGNWGHQYGIPGCYVHTSLATAIKMMPTYDGNLHGIALGSRIHRPFLPLPPLEPWPEEQTTAKERDVLAKCPPPGNSSYREPIEDLPVGDGGGCPGCPLPDTLIMHLYNRAWQEICRHDSSLVWFLYAYMTQAERQGINFGPILGISDPQGSMSIKREDKNAALARIPVNLGYKGYAHAFTEQGPGWSNELTGQPGYYEVTMLDGNGKEFGVVLLKQTLGHAYGGIAYYPAYLDPGAKVAMPDESTKGMAMEWAVKTWATWKTNPEKLISDTPATNVLPAEYFEQDGYNVHHFFEWSDNVPEGLPFFPYMEVSNEDYEVLGIYDRFGQEYKRDADGELCKVFESAGSTTDEETEIVPRKLHLSQNHPNPFNASTRISFSLPEASHVRLTVYDVLGQRVCTLVDEYKTPGSYSVDFDSRTLASGIYFYRLTAGEFTETRKMVLMK